MYCVPLYDSLGEHAIEYIIKHSESTIVFAQAAKLATLAKSLPHVRACAPGAGRGQGRAGMYSRQRGTQVLPFGSLPGCSAGA